MEKDRLGAFIDAVLAIIMTILVLELPRPQTYDLAGLWSLRTNFFASFFPYVTKLIADEFWNKTMQVFYGIIVLLITASVMIYFGHLGIGAGNDDGMSYNLYEQRWIWVDITLKCIGLVLSLTVFPPAMSVSVPVTLIFLVIPSQFRGGEV